ncbi:MAG: NAD(+) synthase [Clostridia bacterium]|nr:NAD(+) synthase [Clostridia bacterium]
MKHGFIKVAAATPKITVADTGANLSEILRLHKKAEELGVKLLVFPELSLTGATCGDLFLSEVLTDSAEKALGEFLTKTKNSDTISIIGFPLVVNDKIYNSAAICQKGQILGVFSKKNLRSKAEYRYFSEYSEKTGMAKLCGQYVPLFGNEQILCCEDMKNFRFCVEIGDDLISPVPLSAHCAVGGALIVANPCASYDTVGSEEYRRMSVLSHSARCVCGYILSGAGAGESTTDHVYGGHSIIAECGNLLAEALPFSHSELTVSEIDVSRLSAERKRSWKSNTETAESIEDYSFDCDITDTSLTRRIDPHPFIPKDSAELARRCETVLSIQAEGLAQRIIKAYAKKCVIGISGGLDSCLALLASVRAMDILCRPHTDIVCVTMPCFGTTTRTRSNAEVLCEELGCQLNQIDITSAVRQHFSDIGHDESNKNVVYENSQARERTQIIMDIANMENGLVVGTGDLSELALGWATYNGDHMSMYGVNADVPKTLVRKIVSHCADDAEKNGRQRLADVLRDIVDTPVSPELLPADESGNISQKTEDLVGPYEIHDFYIYYTLRFGYSPDKLYRLAKIAFAGVYDDETLKKWLISFLRRFFSQQFKRSCLPDGPKVGSVGLSPRGDWCCPSDASAAEWLKIAEKL